MIERELGYQQQLQEFVLKAIREAVAEERAACVKAIEEAGADDTYEGRLAIRAIRARGQS